MSTDNKQNIITSKQGRSTFKYTEFDLACANRMYDRIKAVIPYTPEPNLASWADTLRKMRTIDNIPANQIGNVFKWANQDSFWQSNVLSPAKLRKHFGRLHNLMLQDVTKQQQPRKTRDIPIQESLNDRSWAEGLIDSATNEAPVIEHNADTSLGGE